MSHHPERVPRRREFDRAGLEILDEYECLELIAGVPVGRLIFSDGGLPAAHPVNFVLDGDSVVFCTGDGRKALAAERGDVLGFQVDDIDLDRHLGWSVTVIGHCQLLTDPAEIDRARRLRLRPWASGQHPNYVRVRIESVQGRRIVPWAQRRAPS